MSRGAVDLHSHTTASDGTLTPRELVLAAARHGVTVLAITDHDSTDGLADAMALAPTHRMTIVPGLEINCDVDGAEIHILGYYVDPADERLASRLTRFREERVERAMAMIARLAALGLSIDPERVLELAGPGVVGRPHVAEALVQAGHVAHVDEAFKRYLGPAGQAFVMRPALDAGEAIDLIHDAGGVAVIAHPGLGIEESRLERIADLGLRGIEIWHPQHGPVAVRRLRALAARYGLLETGGSDFHGPQRGADVGELPVPASALQRLKDAAGVPG